MELISVHIPKTAGVCFRRVLQSAYGDGAVLFDYADRILDPDALYHTDRVEWERTQRAPLIERVQANPEIRVVHGHFAASKYAGFYPEARRVVWLREPVARLVSHYHYWRGLPDGGHSLHRRLLEEDLSLEEFAALEPMRDCMSRLFLDGMNLEAFDFVGRQEFFAEDLARLTRMLGWTPATASVANQSERSAAILAGLDTTTRRRLQALNPLDSALYRKTFPIGRGLRLAGITHFPAGGAPALQNEPRRTVSNPAYIFVLSPPFCGSTILWKLVGSSPQVSSLPGEGQFLPEVRDSMRLTPWKEERQMPWPEIKAAWHRHWDLSKPYLLEKSPPNLLRAQEIGVHFDPAYFIILVRDPYALCESLIRRQGLDARAAAEFVIRLLARQAENARGLERCLAFKYEELIDGTPEICAKIQEFLPSLGTLESKSEALVNSNSAKIGQLSQADMGSIGEVLASHEQTMNFWGYQVYG